LEVLEENFGVSVNCLRNGDDFEESWSLLLMKSSLVKPNWDFGFTVEQPCLIRNLLGDGVYKAESISAMENYRL